jgi:hypothetical protein
MVYELAVGREASKIAKGSAELDAVVCCLRRGRVLFGAEVSHSGTTQYLQSLYKSTISKHWDWNTYSFQAFYLNLPLSIT